MGVFRQAPLKYRGQLDGSNSATAFASASMSRWVLTNGAVVFENASGVSQFDFIETWDSVSTSFFRFDASVSSGMFSFNLGIHGIQASEANSGFKIAVDVGATGTGSYSCVFTGYYTGGG